MIIFTDHALKRMSERKISRSYVIKTLQKPQHKEQEDEAVWLLQRRFGNKILGVVAEIKKDKIIVVTLYWI